MQGKLLMNTYNNMENTDPHPDKIFVRDHLTDLEKLLFAQSAIKEFKKENAELKIELGKAQSYIEELKHLVNHDPEIIELERLKTSRDQLRKNNIRLTGENRRLRDENRALRSK